MGLRSAPGVLAVVAVLMMALIFVLVRGTTCLARFHFRNIRGIAGGPQQRVKTVLIPSAAEHREGHIP